MKKAGDLVKAKAVEVEVVDKKELNDQKSIPSCKGTRGGWRPNAGRKPGEITKQTRLKLKKKEQYEKMVIKQVKPLFEAQLSLAKGVNYLFRIDKGTKKAILVEDPKEISRYLEGKTDGGDYYYMTAAKPDNAAIQSMLDRIFGKAVLPVDIKTEVDVNINIRPYKDMSNDDLEKELKKLEG